MGLCLALLTVACLATCPTHSNAKANPIEMKCTFLFSLGVDARGPHIEEMCCSVQLSICLRADCFTAAVCPPSFPSLKWDRSWRRWASFYSVGGSWDVTLSKRSGWWEGRFYEETASGTESMWDGGGGGGGVEVCGGKGLRYGCRQRSSQGALWVSIKLYLLQISSCNLYLCKS